jgi:hypothetical protein
VKGEEGDGEHETGDGALSGCLVSGWISLQMAGKRKTRKACYAFVRDDDLYYGARVLLLLLLLLLRFSPPFFLPPLDLRPGGVVPTIYNIYINL